jgi:hypothetical protein
MSATKESGGSDTESAKNTSTNQSDHDIWLPDTLPKDAHLHEADAVE